LVTTGIAPVLSVRGLAGFESAVTTLGIKAVALPVLVKLA
jgi:hypothetical protein